MENSTATWPAVTEMFQQKTENQMDSLVLLERSGNHGSIMNCHLEPKKEDICILAVLERTLHFPSYNSLYWKMPAGTQQRSAFIFSSEQTNNMVPLSRTSKPGCDESVFCWGDMSLQVDDWRCFSTLEQKWTLSTWLNESFTELPFDLCF